MFCTQNYRVAEEMNPKCQSFMPVSKGILLLLVWSILLNATIAFIIITFEMLSLGNNLQYIFITWSALCVMLPIAGWMGDSFFGRYRAIVVGVFATMLSFLILLCATVMLQFNWTPIPAIALLCLYMVVTTCSMGSFAINILPFILDQNDRSLS